MPRKAMAHKILCIAQETRQVQLYDEVVKKLPGTLLSLEREVYGMFSLINVNFLVECHSCRFQKPACKFIYFPVSFFVV